MAKKKVTAAVAAVASAEDVAGAERPDEQGKAAGPKGSAFVFVGDAKGHGPDEITVFGHTFTKNGEPVSVEDARAAAKLAGNSHFKAA